MSTLPLVTTCLCADVAALTHDANLPETSAANWNEVVALAEAEGLAPALALRLERHPTDALAPALGARLSARFKEALARHVVMSRDLATLLRALSREGIPVIPLKGAFLAEAVYPHPAVRPMSDVDVLVPPADRLRVDELLRGLGYRRGTDAHSWAFDVTYDTATFYDGPGGARVDVHWRLINDPRYAWNHAEAEAVWDRAVPVTLAGEPALALAPEDLVLSLAAHLAIHHGLSGLLWYWDLKLVLDRWAATLDGDALVMRAERWRVRRALYFVLRRLGELFAVPDVARVTAARLVPRGPRAASVRWLVAHREDRLRGFEHVLPLLLTDSLADLLRVLRPSILPSPSWLRARYGADSVSLPRAYLAHGARMADVVRVTARGMRSYRAR
jgi:hypothetical protein